MQYRNFVGFLVLACGVLTFATGKVGDAFELSADCRDSTTPLLRASEVWTSVRLDLDRSRVDWSTVFTRPLLIRWLARAVADSVEPYQGAGPEANGQISFTNSEGKETVIPLVCDHQREPVIFSVGQPPKMPSRELTCLGTWVAGRIHGAIEALGATGGAQWRPCRLWSDHGLLETDLEADFFQQQGCYRLVAETLEELLPTSESALESWIRTKQLFVEGFLSCPREQSPSAARLEVANRFAQLVDSLVMVGRYEDALKWLETLEVISEKDQTRVDGVAFSLYVRKLASRKTAEIQSKKGM